MAQYIYGIVVLDAMLGAQLSLQRDGDLVEVKVECVKNAKANNETAALA